MATIELLFASLLSVVMFCSEIGTSGDLGSLAAAAFMATSELGTEPRLAAMTPETSALSASAPPPREARTAESARSPSEVLAGSCTEIGRPDKKTWAQLGADATQFNASMELRLVATTS